MTWAPAWTQSIIADASSSGVALGMSPFADDVSAKIGRMIRVHAGQIDGAAEPLFAHKMPATNVPCMHAALVARSQVPPISPETSWIVVVERSGWLVATGPSMSAILVSARPLVICINGLSLTSSRGLRACWAVGD